MPSIEIHFSTDWFICATIPEWIEMLDMYDLDDAHELFYSILHPITRERLNDYWRIRMYGYKNN